MNELKTLSTILKIMHKGIMRNLLILLLLAFPLLSLGDSKHEDLFAKGNALYAKASYKEATGVYRQLLDSGFVSADLYFNLGNAYYKLREMPLAILNYEKAYKLSPGDEDIYNNIQLANLGIKDKIEAVPEFFLAKWWRSVLLFVSAEVLSILSVIGILLAAALLIIYLLSVDIKIKKPAFYAGIVVLVLSLLTVSLGALQTSYLKNSNNAIVFTGTVNVKSGPKESFKTLFVIHEGTKVGVQQTTDGWIKVLLPNGSIGWIEFTDVKGI